MTDIHFETSNPTIPQTGEKQKVVLAYSGGLDTSVMCKWLQVEKGLDVVAICGNVGQNAANLEWVKQKALAMGAIGSEAVDMREEYAEEILPKAIAANALYENEYPLLSALSRPLISKHIVDIAHKYGATYVAHGCTGKGNDQVRFETSIHALDPDLKVIAPVRGWDLLTREDEMVWAADHSVPVPTTAAKPYSIDDNLWGRAIECGVLEDPWAEPPADIWTMTVDPTEAPDVPEEVTLAFEQGKPVALNGQRMGLVDMIVELNKICGRNGYRAPGARDPVPGPRHPALQARHRPEMGRDHLRRPVVLAAARGARRVLREHAGVCVGRGPLQALQGFDDRDRSPLQLRALRLQPGYLRRRRHLRPHRVRRLHRAPQPAQPHLVQGAGSRVRLCRAEGHGPDRREPARPPQFGGE